MHPVGDATLLELLFCRFLDKKPTCRYTEATDETMQLKQLVRNPHMRNVTIATVLLFLGAGAVITLSGCREESGDTGLRRARLVGNENIELKKEIKLRDKEIERQKQLVKQCRAEWAKDKELSGNNTLMMLKHLAESEAQVRTLAAENTQLKEKIKELEAKLASQQEKQP